MFDGILDGLGDIISEAFMRVLFGFLFETLYYIQVSIASLIDLITEIFLVLAGIDTVTVGGRQTDLLSHFLQSSGVRTAFFGVLLISVVLLVVFTIVAIIRSEYVDGQQKRTKWQIMTKAGQSLLSVLLIPFLLTVGILLTNVVMGSIHSTMMTMTGDGARLSFGGQILVIAGYNAYIGPEYMRETVERMFMTGELNFVNPIHVMQFYRLSDMNFILGIGGSAILLIVLALAAIRFIQRLFDIILLFIVSPVSAATMPLDDGARFKMWREQLISKVLGAYGIIIAMNLFFMIMPQINQIRFFSGGFQNGVVQLLFMIGGAFAVTKAYHVIAQLTGNNTSGNDMQQIIMGARTSYRVTKGAVVGAVSIFAGPAGIGAKAKSMGLNAANNLSKGGNKDE